MQGATSCGARVPLRPVPINPLAIRSPYRYRAAPTMPDPHTSPLQLVRSPATLLAALCFAVSPVQAATPQEVQAARLLFAQAEVDERAGSWDAALRKLERVIAVKETAGVRFHIASCHSHLGHLTTALEGYERARRLAQEQQADDVLAMLGPSLGDLRSRTPLIRVTVSAGARAMVLLDGVTIRREQFAEIRVDPGTHQVVITVDGVTRLDRQFRLAEGGSETVDLPTPGLVASGTVPVKKASSPAPAEPAAVPTLAWTAFGTGVALGAVGWLAYLRADSVASESERRCATSLACDPDRASLVRQWDGAALGLWIASAAALGTGVTLSVLGGRASPRASAVVLRPGAVGVQGRF